MLKIWKESGLDSRPESILKLDDIRDNWLKPNREVQRPGTVRSYLGTLKQFFSFLQSGILDNRTEEVRSAKDRVDKWLKTLSGDEKLRKTERTVSDISKLCIFITHN
jgi:hypothetical protein